MSLKEQIQKDIKESLKNKEELKVSVLKMLLASILNKEIELTKKEVSLSPEEEQQVLKSEAKKRRKAIEAYEKAGRQDLANKEKEELEILKSYDYNHELDQKANSQHPLAKD